MIAIILALVVIAICYYVFQTKKNVVVPNDYWEKKGIPSIPVEEIFKDNTNVLSMAERFNATYAAYKAKGLKHIGTVENNKPNYRPMDLDIIKHILVKDFNYFTNRGLDYDLVNNPLSGHVFNLEDEMWKKWRVRLSPTFTTGKMRMMLPTIIKCAEPLKGIFEEYVKTKTPVDIKEILACYTTDVIGSCAFGIECNCLKNPNAEFRVYGRNYMTEISRVNIQYSFWDTILPKCITDRFTAKYKALGGITKFFIDAVEKNVEYREQNNIHRKDFMHMLIQIRNHGSVKDDDSLGTGSGKKHVSMIDLTAQAFVFYIAGFETSSTLMTMACYELASHQDCQDKLRKDILHSIEKHGGLTYDAINDMTYLEKVLNETMRIHPPIPELFRTCARDYKVPGMDLVLEKGTDIKIDVSAIQRDPTYYPNPDQFDPENFSKERIESRPAFTFLPFGDGPRNCIGLRFGKLQAKVGLISLLRHFKIALNEKTIYPIEYDPWHFLISVKGELFLDLEQLS